MFRRPIAVLAAAVAAAAGGVAGAEEPVRVAVEWTRGPDATECAGEEAIRDAVAAQVRRNTVVTSNADVIIRGSSERRGESWHASIHVVRTDGAEIGSRELDEASPACGALDDALIVVLAMIVDSSMVAGAGRAREPTPPEPPPPPPPAPAPAPGPSWSVAVVLSAAAELGRLPGTTAGAELSVRLDPPHVWPLELSGLATTEGTAETAMGGSTFRLVAGAALACPFGTGRRLQLEACAGAQAGSIGARAFGFVDNRQRRRLIVDGRLELRAAVAISRLVFVRAVAGGWLSLVRPRFSYETQGGALQSLYQPEIVAGFAQIGVGVRFQ